MPASGRGPAGGTALDSLAASVASLTPISDDDAHLRDLESSGEGWIAQNIRVLDAIARFTPEETSSEQREPPGAMIGPYTLLERLGEGGMGIVYRARQKEPLDRVVALKLLRGRHTTRLGAERFEMERRTLARLEHPNIARILDARAGGVGRPYVAMELVEGEPVVAYCDARRMPLAARIDLFITVCDAVQHAHEHGVLHRDLKPSNVLVGEISGRHVAKIIDFGIAKTLASEATPDGTGRGGDLRAVGLTLDGQLLGTPEYMSPESADASVLDGDTRSDIYALGVVLFELLTGRLPFHVVDRADIASIQRALRVRTPPQASSIVAGDHDRETERAAHARATTPRDLVRCLREDLDWILSKALATDRRERYASASELALDLRRHLTHEPVLAAPADRSYRVRAFARRHRASVSAIGLVFVFLGVGVAATTWQARRARAAERAARQQAEVASAVSAFVVDMLGRADPTDDPDAPRTTVREVVELAADEMAEGHERPPEVEAGIRRALGNTRSALADDSAAEADLTRALDLYRALGRDDEAARTLVDLAHHQLRTAQLAEAARSAREAHDLVTSREGDRSREAGATTLLLARVMLSLGHFDRADSLFARGLDIGRNTSAVDDPRFVDGLHDYANLLSETARYDESLAAMEATAAALEARFGGNSPRVAAAIANLGWLHQRRGELDEARRDFTRAADIHERAFGPDHPSRAGALAGLGAVLEALDESVDAESVLTVAEGIYRRVRGERHHDVATVRGHIGAAQLAQGHLALAEASLREALEIMLEAQPEDPQLFTFFNNLAAVQRRRGALNEAEETFREAIERAQALYGAESLNAAMVTHNLARTMSEAGRYPAALAEFERAIEWASRALPAGHANLAVMTGNYGECLMRANRRDEARAVLEEAHAALVEALGAGHRRTVLVAGWLEEARAGSSPGR